MSVVVSPFATPVMNFLKAKSKILNSNFSKSSSSSCPGIYGIPLSISGSLYCGNVSSLGTVTLSTFDSVPSLSSTSFPSLSVEPVISAIFVIFSYRLMFSFTLHLICTSM